MSKNLQYELVMYNDKVNDIPYVMACLIRFCKHETLQAEQCAMITHNNQKCIIKIGELSDLISIKSELQELGLIVELDTHDSIMY